MIFFNPLQTKHTIYFVGRTDLQQLNVEIIDKYENVIYNFSNLDGLQYKFTTFISIDLNVVDGREYEIIVTDQDFLIWNGMAKAGIGSKNIVFIPDLTCDNNIITCDNRNVTCNMNFYLEIG